MTALHAAGAVELARRVRDGELSAQTLAEATLGRIAARDAEVNAFTLLTAERAMHKAAAIDAMRARGEALPALAGVPFAVKNLFDIAGEVTVAGSKILREQPPATHDATLLARLDAAGAVLVGALNQDEFAYGVTTENSHYGPVRNPHDAARSAGGSSGGSGAALAAGMVALTLASDTNGSIRVPSSLCGVFGLKPTFGRLSRAGTYPFVASLDHLGPLARSSADLAASYDAMQGRDPRDPVCATRPVEPTAPALATGMAGLRVALADGYFEQFADEDARAAVAIAAETLGVTARVTIPAAAEGRAAAFIVSAAEGASLHLEHLRTRAQDFDPVTRDRFLANALLPAAWYVRAQKLRRWYRDQVLPLFARWDLILAPATPRSAPLLGETHFLLNGERQLTRPAMGLLTQPISCLGLPVAAVPIPRPGKLPLGVQIIAAPWREDLCLRTAAALERAGVAGAPLAPVFV
jgi:amidase/aspartyl-tRNA(Asn)/glutamyl-tRNA(Gln) amidotransferase subunit A